MVNYIGKIYSFPLYYVIVRHNGMAFFFHKKTKEYSHAHMVHVNIQQQWAKNQIRNIPKKIRNWLHSTLTKK
jgi:hypothetical protein